MFTITHEFDDGQQEVFTAVQVQYLPFTEANGDSAGVHFLCGPGEGGPGISAGHVKTGRVFVMNEKGATVARYYLDRPKRAPSLSGTDNDGDFDWAALQRLRKASA